MLVCLIGVRKHPFFNNYYLYYFVHRGIDSIWQNTIILHSTNTYIVNNLKPGQMITSGIIAGHHSVHRGQQDLLSLDSSTLNLPPKLCTSIIYVYASNATVSAAAAP